MLYDARAHAARWTDDYLFNQLIPYIGNKRKLLPLIGEAIAAAELGHGAHFVDLFAGSGVVSRFAKTLGFRVTANDWEPYAGAINGAHVALDAAPDYRGRAYEEVIATLNDLPPVEGWVTKHLCPDDDDNPDPARDRMFYLRRNGMRIDAIRAWIEDQRLEAGQRNALLAPLLYQACYVANVSGVFKGFHRGWGGQTGTALHRIKADLTLRPAIFHANGFAARATAMDAAKLAGEAADFVYLDPPYNQHPYGSNYHVLNSIALDDRPLLSAKIEGRGSKSAIRTDWRSERRSAYNHRGQALAAYRALVGAIDARWIATSYSTDGNIAVADMVAACVARGDTSVFVQGYKRYRVSSQRMSPKPMNVEFVLLTDTAAPARTSAQDLVAAIEQAERIALDAHPQTASAIGRV
ncbi:DNA adenine methylase [Sphingomonas crocodyli]|uniref:site-specific DNA-methyltransferase (adenine-specific) n=1 Tax=Sphingomonas crocodyli TaxID=1979270 RepID=A0A437MB86_9SPHN|nr:DNA adenine methylase [Sphingomonas crocodyli]RVT94907.1 DNA methyltransferase [Sphingomonas crocodyli]